MYCVQQWALLLVSRLLRESIAEMFWITRPRSFPPVLTEGWDKCPSQLWTVALAKWRRAFYNRANNARFCISQFCISQFSISEGSPRDQGFYSSNNNDGEEQQEAHRGYASNNHVNQVSPACWEWFVFKSCTASAFNSAQGRELLGYWRSSGRCGAQWEWEECICYDFRCKKGLAKSIWHGLLAAELIVWDKDG